MQYKEEQKVEPRIFGYARVSSKEQNLDRQILALKQYVKEDMILTDKASGKNLERESYQALKSPLGLRAGDELFVTSLDRLSRNKEELQKEVCWFREHKIQLRVLDLPTSLVDVEPGQQWMMELIQNLMLELLSSLAEQERLTIRKRQREGIEAAKIKGKHLGRPKLRVPENFDELYNRVEIRGDYGKGGTERTGDIKCKFLQAGETQRSCIKRSGKLEKYI